DDALERGLDAADRGDGETRGEGPARGVDRPVVDRERGARTRQHPARGDRPHFRADVAWGFAGHLGSGSWPGNRTRHRFYRSDAVTGLSCPGRSAARSGALQTRDRYEFRVSNGPASAVHRFALHRVRDTRATPAPKPPTLQPSPQEAASRASRARRGP